MGDHKNCRFCPYHRAYVLKKPAFQFIKILKKLVFVTALMNKLPFHFLCIFLFFASLKDSFGLSATDIIRSSENAMRGNTQRADMEITIKTKRWTRTMMMRSWENRLQKKSFSVILSPAKDAGNRFLLIDKRMWHYLPKLQQTIKISPSMMLQSWMGSDFSNDDIVKESSIINDYNHILDGIHSIDGHQCYRILLKPKPDAAVVWGKIVYYSRTQDHLPVKEEYYNEHDILKKILSFSEYKKVNDRVIPTFYKMETVGRQDQYTIMKIRNALFNLPLPATIFSLQNLTAR